MDQKIEQRFKNTASSKTFRNMIKAFNLDKKAVLDLGCSYGEFLAHFGSGSVGITIIEEEVTYGKKRGLDIRMGDIESERFSLDQKFDVIFANNLFEHLDSPHKFLFKIKKYLKPEGILILGVPCIPKIVWLLHFRKFRGSLASLHINYFTRDTLVKTVESGGWKVSAARGFHIASAYVDWMLNAIYPHFYVIASVDHEFAYSQKRMKEVMSREPNL